MNTADNNDLRKTEKSEKYIFTHKFFIFQDFKSKFYMVIDITGTYNTDQVLFKLLI